MQTRNNYDKDVFNGDIGNITAYAPRRKEVAVLFNSNPVTYHLSDLDEIDLAYAVTVHKSQCSEYKAIIIPIATQHYVLLNKNLLYTAITRGRDLVVLVASPKALRLALEEKNIEKRFTNLIKRLGNI